MTAAQEKTASSGRGPEATCDWQGWQQQWRAGYQRTRAILRATALTLRQHPRLLWFPVIAVMGSVAVFLGALILFAVLSAVISGALADPALAGLALFDDPDRGEVFVRVQGVAGLVALYGVNCVTVFTGVALTHASMEALSGRAWSVEGSLEHAHERLPQILSYAVAVWLAGLILGRRRRRRRRRGGLLSFAWRAVTYLVLPVISREGRGAVEAIQRSASLVKETWREGLIGHLSLRWIWLPLSLVLVLPLVLCGLLEIEEPLIIVGVLCCSLSALGVAALFLHTVEIIYRAALYMFATEGVVPEPYDCDELHCVWCVKGPADAPLDDLDLDVTAEPDDAETSAASDDAKRESEPESEPESAPE